MIIELYCVIVVVVIVRYESIATATEIKSTQIGKIIPNKYWYLF